VDPQSVGRATIESLIKAGAFDNCGGGNRAQLTAVVEKAMQAGASALADKKRGQKGLFADVADESVVAGKSSVPLPSLPDWPEREKLNNEKEVLGFYLTSHP